MADALKLARAARTTLAAALRALQGPGIPAELLNVAEPIAQSMAILHRIEQSGGKILDGRIQALENVRSALDLLQNHALEHDSVQTALEAVAGSLSKMFALSRAAPVGAAPQAQPAPNATGPRPRQRALQPQPAQKPQEPRKRQRALRQQAGARQKNAAALPQAASGGKRVRVHLGAHSSSNLYKGLSGNDIIEHGGIFVATYDTVAVGTALTLHVLLPGDLEFVADAEVRWTRETVGGESDPGFGARLVRVPPEGRQLVYRYARNREPMFYDDM